MFLFSYTAAVLALFSAGTAAFILYKKRNDRLSVYFCWYLFWLAIWVGGNGAADLSTTDFSARFWSGICLIGGTLFIGSYLAFAEYFIDEKPLSPLKTVLFFGPPTFFTAIAFTPFYVTEVFITHTEPTGMALGKVNYTVLVYTVGSMLYAFGRLIGSYKNASRIKQRQTVYLAIGFFFLIFGAVVFTIILPFRGEFRYFTLGPQFSLITIILTAYAIFKHRLLDIKVAIQRGLIFSILLTIIIATYLATLFFILYVVESNTTLPYLASGIVTTTLGIFAIPYIEKKLRRATDRFFFKDTFDFAKAMEELGTLVSTFNRSTELTEQAATTLERTLRVDRVLFSLAGKPTSIALTTPTTETTPHIDSTAHQPVTITTTPEIEEDKWTIRLPLSAQGEHIATMFVGHKLSGDQFSDDDIQLVTMYSRYMAIALKKALLYQEVLDYSENLTQKVDDRTREIKTLQQNQVQLILDLSHELQTPLTVISGELEMRRGQLGDVTAIEKSIQRISAFIRALLRLSKMEAIGDAVPKESFNLSELTNEVIEYVTTMTEAVNITLTNDVQQFVFMYGNREQIEQLITNLLSNAIKYIANERTIHVSLRQDENGIRLQIADSGIGIPKEHIPQLFKRFQRLESGPKKEGTGLGLALCDTIVRNHGGTITIESTVGKGTLVSVSFSK